jgi:hypothetical protein
MMNSANSRSAQKEVKMIYMESRYGIVPRYKLSQALDVHRHMIFPMDNKYMEKVGARFVGIFTYLLGNDLGQIVVLSAWPSIEAWTDVDKAFQADHQDEESKKKDGAEWLPLITTTTRNIMIPAPHSPLQ